MNIKKIVIPIVGLVVAGLLVGVACFVSRRVLRLV